MQARARASTARSTLSWDAIHPSRPAPWDHVTTCDRRLLVNVCGDLSMGQPNSPIGGVCNTGFIDPFRLYLHFCPLAQVCGRELFKGWSENMGTPPYNVDNTIINHPFGNGLYHLFMVIWGMVYLLFYTH